LSLSIVTLSLRANVQGRDHLIVCAWWGAWRAWEQGSHNKENSLWELLKSNGILATYDEFFARDWNKVLCIDITRNFFVCSSMKTLLFSNASMLPRGYEINTSFVSNGCLLPFVRIKITYRCYPPSPYSVCNTRTLFVFPSS